ncbi:hypothetical protein B0H21DRAFT_747623 [Amylocystis lapponica]|nr:hypothetical protein B0H21DRAFT_747623 [Amylocystis lapponica]
MLTPFPLGTTILVYCVVSFMGFVLRRARGHDRRLMGLRDEHRIRRGRLRLDVSGKYSRCHSLDANEHSAKRKGLKIGTMRYHVLYDHVHPETLQRITPVRQFCLSDHPLVFRQRILIHCYLYSAALKSLSMPSCGRALPRRQPRYLASVPEARRSLLASAALPPPQLPMQP